MIPITKDPKRRIRRIQRWTRAALSNGGMAPHASCMFHVFDQHWRSDASLDNAVERLNEANAMFAKESAWLCDYALRITTDHGRATSRLGETEVALGWIAGHLASVSTGIAQRSTPSTVANATIAAFDELKVLRAERKREP